MGKKRGLEKKSNEERLNGIEDGTRLGESEERGRWLAEGHGPGLCSKPYDERRKGHEEGIEEGKNLGREEGFWLAKNAFDKIIHAVKTKEQANDSLQRMSETTQTTTPTADAVTKTTPNDKPPRLLNDAGIQANDEQPPSPKNAGTSTDSPHSSQTTHSTVVIDPPPTTATRTAPSAATQLQTPRKRRHMLPARPTTPQPSLPPLVWRPEPLLATATSLPTTAVTPATTTPKTASRAASSTQTATTPS